MKPVLYVRLGRERLDLFLKSKKGKDRFRQIFLRESSQANVAAAVKAFVSEPRRPETVLLLPRSDVLQKELALSAAGGRDLTREIESRIRETLPYSPDEMAYGIALETRENPPRGLLMSVPEKYLQEVLSYLDGVGIEPDEIFTEDQALGWSAASQCREKAALVLERSEQTMLCVYVRDQQLRFSRSFPISSQINPEGLAEVIQDLSLALIESGAKPQKMVLAGDWNAGEMNQLEAAFSLPAEKLLQPEEASRIEASLYGASLHQGHARLSLLPRERKVQKWKNQSLRNFKQAVFSGLLFTILVPTAFALHLQHLHHKAARLDQELIRVRSQSRDVLVLERKLRVMQNIQKNRSELLRLFKELGLQMPASVALREFEISGDSFRFVGEGPSHSVMTQAVDFFERLEFIENAKLERTRLRKRLNQEFFEFEVTGLWQIGEK